MDKMNGQKINHNIPHTYILYRRFRGDQTWVSLDKKDKYQPPIARQLNGNNGVE